MVLIYLNQKIQVEVDVNHKADTLDGGGLGGGVQEVENNQKKNYLLGDIVVVKVL